MLACIWLESVRLTTIEILELILLGCLLILQIKEGGLICYPTCLRLVDALKWKVINWTDPSFSRPRSMRGGSLDFIWTCCLHCGCRCIYGSCFIIFISLLTVTIIFILHRLLVILTQWLWGLLSNITVMSGFNPFLISIHIMIIYLWFGESIFFYCHGRIQRVLISMCWLR